EMVGGCDQPLQYRIGVDLKHPGHGPDAQPFRQCPYRPDEQVGRHPLPMQRGTMRLLEIAPAAGAMQLAPRSTVGMPIGPDIAQPHPTPIGTGGLWAEMR